VTQIFIELYNYRPAWHALDAVERSQFASAVTSAVNQLAESGAEVLGYGSNATDTSHRAPYDFFCAYRLPNAAAVRTLEVEIERSGWHGFFDQVAVSGLILPHAEALAANARLDAPTNAGKE
jgi:haloalkane dehalogenase